MNVRRALAISAIVASVGLAAQNRPSGTSLLVSTAWLAEHLRDRGLVILQTSQAPAGRAQIPGARVVPHESLMTMTAGHDLAAASDLVAAVEKAGVSNASHVVIYGEPLAAGWLFFALDYLGHDKISMLDGNLEKWRGEGRPLSPSAAPPIAGRFVPHVRAQLKSSAEAVQNRPRGTVLLDARTPKEYGSGCIPSARLLTWNSVYADAKLQVFKSPNEVAALFAAAGAPAGTAVITYCQIGLRSSLLYFAARYAGLDTSNYVGSWSDWSGRKLPAETPK